MTSPTHHKFFVRGQRERYLSLVGLELVRCINCRKVSPSCCSLAKTHCSSLPEYLIFAAGSLSFCTVSRGVNPQLYSDVEDLLFRLSQSLFHCLNSLKIDKTGKGNRGGRGGGVKLRSA